MISYYRRSHTIALAARSSTTLHARTVCVHDGRMPKRIPERHLANSTPSILLQTLQRRRSRPIGRLCPSAQHPCPPFVPPWTRACVAVKKNKPTASRHKPLQQRPIASSDSSRAHFFDQTKPPPRRAISP